MSSLDEFTGDIPIKFSLTTLHIMSQLCIHRQVPTLLTTTLTTSSSRCIMLVQYALHILNHLISLFRVAVLECHIHEQSHLPLVQVHNANLVLECVEFDLDLLHAEVGIVNVVA